MHDAERDRAVCSLTLPRWRTARPARRVRRAAPGPTTVGASERPERPDVAAPLRAPRSSMPDAGGPAGQVDDGAPPRTVGDAGVWLMLAAGGIHRRSGPEPRILPSSWPRQRAPVGPVGADDADRPAGVGGDRRAGGTVDRLHRRRGGGERAAWDAEHRPRHGPALAPLGPGDRNRSPVWSVSTFSSTLLYLPWEQVDPEALTRSCSSRPSI